MLHLIIQCYYKCILLLISHNGMMIPLQILGKAQTLDVVTYRSVGTDLLL